MAGNHSNGSDEFNGFEGVIWSHGKVITNGKYGDIDIVIRQPFHIVSQGCVASVIDGGAIVQLEQEAAGVAAVGSIGQAGTMMGDGHFTTTEGELVAATDVQWVYVFHALCAQPANDRSPCHNRSWRASYRIARNVLGLRHVATVVRAGRVDFGIRLSGGMR